MGAIHAPIGQLKARLSEYLARARAGEEVVITDRGTPIARLVPLSGVRALEGRNVELARAGLKSTRVCPFSPPRLPST